MAANEGLRRVHKLGRMMAITAAVFLLLALIISLVASHIPNRVAAAPILALLLGTGWWLFLLGILVSLLAWIGEGFAKKEPEE